MDIKITGWNKYCREVNARRAKHGQSKMKLGEKNRLKKALIKEMLNCRAKV